MEWKVRVDDGEILPGKNAPSYGSNSEYFTIRMHHGGRICNFGSTIYVGGKFNHIDYCSQDEMSLLEIFSMAKEIGVVGAADSKVSFYYSRMGINDCSLIKVIENDKDALDICYYLDDERTVGVFVHPVMEEEASYAEIISQLPSVNEPVAFMGDDENEEVNNAIVEVEDHLLFDKDFNSDDEQSMGDDSEISDCYIDSDYEANEDDTLDGVDVQVRGLNGKSLNEIAESLARKEREKTDKLKEKMQHHGLPMFNPKTDMDDPVFYLGQTFSDTPTFRAAVRQHSRICGRLIRFPKNDSDKVQVKCKEKNCPWSIYASKLPGEDTMAVKTLHNEHECYRAERVPAASSSWLAEKYKHKIQSDPTWPVDSMLQVMQHEQKLHFSKHQMYRAKNKVAEMSRGSLKQQYAMLWNYATELMTTNPGTTVKIQTKTENDEILFKRFYCCWGALKKGLLDGCRPVICLDGCHLKSICGGIFLTAVGVDPNNAMFPFAYAIVEKEKTNTWLWFLELLIADLDIHRGASNWLIISDKQKGLIDAVETLLPFAEHRFCVMHLYKNFKLQHKGLALKIILWKAAKATRIVDFEKIMKGLRERDIEAFKWLAKRPAAQWSKSYFKTFSKCDMLLNNMCESFNSSILLARKKSIIDMLEEIRMKLMKRVYVRRNLVKNHRGDLTPAVHKLLEEYKKESMNFNPHWNGHEQFEVQGAYEARFTVDLVDKLCSCRKWQLTGIPCPHAIAGIYFMGQKPESYVDACYHKNTYLRVYSHVMHPLHAPEEWPQSGRQTLLPPIKEIMPGRPKKYSRRRDDDETIDKYGKKKMKNVGYDSGRLGRQGLIMRCRMCAVVGHNIRSCPNNPKNQNKADNIEVPPAGCGTSVARKRKIQKGKKKQHSSNKQTTQPTQEQEMNTQSSIVGPSTMRQRKKLIVWSKTKTKTVTQEEMQNITKRVVNQELGGKTKGKRKDKRI